MTIYDVDATDLIEELAKELQNIETIKPPEWATFVKTGASRERPPARKDWWYMRSASVLRKVNIRGPIGVSKLRTIYGGKKNRGHQPEIFRKSSGNILRKILQQLEKAELVKQEKKSAHKGRIITPKGIKLMNSAAKKIGKPVPKKVEEVKAEKTETKTEKPKEVKGKKETKQESHKSKISEGLETKSQSQPKTTAVKTEELVKKTKEFAEGKVPTAEKLVQEAKKENKK